MERLGDTLGSLLRPELANADPLALREDLDQRREEVWHRACQMGRCRYAILPRTATELPPSVDSSTTCGGYHGTRTLELAADPGRSSTVWRWRLCLRHLAWANEQGRLKLAEASKYAKRRKGIPEPHDWEG